MTNPMVTNGTHYDCWICGCKPGEPHGPALPVAPTPSSYPDDEDPED